MVLFAVLIAPLCTRMVASLIIASWNQLMDWLKGIENTPGLRAAYRRTPRLPYHASYMGKRELITRELDRLPERDLDKLLAFLRTINDTNSDAAMPMVAWTLCFFMGSPSTTS